MPQAELAPFPDLLHPSPLRRIDVERTKLAINLAFAGGTSGGLFSEALERATLAPSTWEPSGFAADLFVQRFVSQCFAVRVGRNDSAISTSHLVQLLSHPPADPAVVQHRRAILAELSGSPSLR